MCVVVVVSDIFSKTQMRLLLLPLWIHIFVYLRPWYKQVDYVTVNRHLIGVVRTTH
jgi:hypothetical protein